MITYLANPSKGAVLQSMVDGALAFIDTPAQGNRRPPGVTWCADNGCFGKGYPGDRGYIIWLAKHRAEASTCLFATAPDVVGDAAATLARSAPFYAPIRRLGYKVALVAQDGLEDLTVPWDDFDVLFIGGSTEWKLSDAAALLCFEAKERGKWVHMGRVNSRKRLRIAESFGCDSVDGTYLTYGPIKNLPKLLSWLDEFNTAKEIYA